MKQSRTETGKKGNANFHPLFHGSIQEQLNAEGEIVHNIF